MTVFIMNTDRKVNPSKPIVDEDDQKLIIVEKKNGALIAIRGAKQVYTDFGKVGDWTLITIDTGLRHRDGGSGRIIGFVTADSAEGDIPTKKVPVYVFK